MKEPLVTIELSEYEQLKDLKNQFPLISEKLITGYVIRQTILKDVGEKIGYINKSELIRLIENVYGERYDDIYFSNEEE